jgi:rod shape-determining protein MreC
MLKIKSKISKFPLVILVLVLIVLFYGLSLKPSGRLPWHQQVLFSVLHPFQKSINFIGEQVGGVWNHYFNLVGVTHENEVLKKKNSEQAYKLNDLQEIQAENTRLRRLMRFRDRHGLEPIGAEIIANDPRGDFRVVTIDKGAKDGIVDDTPVFVAEGLVGRVADVGDSMSRVLLITDPNSAVDVLVQRSRARALLSGTKVRTELKSNYYLSRLEYLNRKSDIQNGDIIVTSGLDGVYSPGIPIGVVANLEHNIHGVFRNAQVIPFVDFNNLEEVLVGTR